MIFLDKLIKCMSLKWIGFSNNDISNYILFRKTYKLDIETQLDTQKLGNMSLQILRKGENEMAKKS